MTINETPTSLFQMGSLYLRIIIRPERGGLVIQLNKTCFWVRFILVRFILVRFFILIWFNQNAIIWFWFIWFGNRLPIEYPKRNNRTTEWEADRRKATEWLACSAPSRRWSFTAAACMPRLVTRWRLSTPHLPIRRRRRRREGDKGVEGRANGIEGGVRILCNCKDAAFGELAAAGGGGGASNFGSPTLRPRQLLGLLLLLLLQCTFFYLFLAPDLSNKSCFCSYTLQAIGLSIFLTAHQSISAPAQSKRKDRTFSPWLFYFFWEKIGGYFTCACNY